MRVILFKDVFDLGAPLLLQIILQHELMTQGDNCRL